MANEFTFEIVERGAVLEAQSKGWNLELNKVSWSGREPKWDVRPWNEDHTQCGKGITLTEKALANLVTFITKGVDSSVSIETR